MKLSTRGHYAVLALVDLARHPQEEPVSLAEIAQRQSLPHQYLEQLFSKLRRHHLVISIRGHAGGYVLSRSPGDITIADIINAVEEPMKSTLCSTTSPLGCRGQSSKCLTHYLWAGMDTIIQDYLKTITLEAVLENRIQATGTVELSPRPLKSCEAFYHA